MFAPSSKMPPRRRSRRARRAEAVDYFAATAIRRARLGLDISVHKTIRAHVAARTHEDVIELAEAAHFGADSRSAWGELDAKRPDTYVGVVQSGLGTPDRDYYLKDDAKPARQAKYRDYVETIPKLAGYPEAVAPMQSSRSPPDRQLHWPREKSDRSYLQPQIAPGSLWPRNSVEAGLRSFGAPAQDFFIVAQLMRSRVSRSFPIRRWRLGAPTLRSTTLIRWRMFCRRNSTTPRSPSTAAP
jgi:hypothetical protein